MPEKYVYFMASFDEETSTHMKQRLQDVCSVTQSFDLYFSHIGLFGLKVLFLAPDVNNALLDLFSSLHDDSAKSIGAWTAHATIFIDEAEAIQKALPIIAHNFQPFQAKVTGVSLYEFFPTRFIAACNLK